MSKRNRGLIIVFAVVLLVLGGSLVLQRIGPQRTLTLEISGEPGREVAGTVELDSEPKSLAGALPAKFTYRGRRISYAVAPVGGKPGEQITVKTYIDNEASSSCVAEGVKGTFVRVGMLGLGEKTEGTAGMTAQEIAQLQR